MQQVGRDLGVRHVLEGSVRKISDRVCVTGQLVDAGTGAHVWAEHYDRRYEEIFAFRTRSHYRSSGRSSPAYAWPRWSRQAQATDSLDAYDLVLEAQSNVYTRMPAPSIKALARLDAP